MRADAAPKSPRRNSPGKGKEEPTGATASENHGGGPGSKEETKSPLNFATQPKPSTPIAQVPPPNSQSVPTSFQPVAPASFQPAASCFPSTTPFFQSAAPNAQTTGNWQAPRSNVWGGPQPWKPRPPGFGWTPPPNQWFGQKGTPKGGGWIVVPPKGGKGKSKGDDGKGKGNGTGRGRGGP